MLVPPPPYDWDGIAGPQEPTIIKKSKITDKQAKLLVARAFSNKWSNKDLQGFFLKRFNVKELKDLDFKEMDTAVKYVSKPFMEAMKDTGESPF